MKIVRLCIIILVYSYTLLLVEPAFSQIQNTSTIDHSIQRAVHAADQKQHESQRQQAMINDYYNKGRACYQARRFQEAKGYFEKILDMDPSYEPAKLYIESAIIRLEVVDEYQAIQGLKLKMADIIAEYDRRREHVSSLAVKYFLEQAQRKCQIGDFKGAEELYNLCYRVNPYNKNKIEWFVKATHDLVKLYQELDERTRKIEELTAFEP